MISKETVTVTVSALGAATVRTTRPMDGYVHAVVVAIGTLAAGAVDLTITNASDGGAILALTNLAASGTYLPRIACSNATGGALTWYDKPTVNGYIQIVAADGGVST
ncbi:MAG: hypothetical protein V2A79_19265, partial [Planctomycetota bacterium]